MYASTAQRGVFQPPSHHKVLRMISIISVEADIEGYLNLVTVVLNGVWTIGESFSEHDAAVKSQGTSTI